MENGLRLGPIGGRIVGEVIIGLLQLDPNSFMADEPHWRPVLPPRSGKVTGDFRMVDFLTLAGVAQLTIRPTAWPGRDPERSGLGHVGPAKKINQFS
jgi:hypothetical protein